MLVAIDGTGSTNYFQYERATRQSFVRELASLMKSWPCFPVLYQRGPSLLSIGFGALDLNFTISQVRDLGRLAVRFILRHACPPDPIVLAGYSRGAAACIQAARMLQREAPSLRIDCLALFDAVDRDLLADVKVIPANVKAAYHALRHEGVLSRWYFGNCGLRHEIPDRLRCKRFWATHSALGGMPWQGDHPCRTVPAPGFDRETWLLQRERGVGSLPPTICVPTTTVLQDEQAVREIRRWMWANLRKHVPLS